MDLFGPLPKTNRGATIILVLIDHFTRWAEPIALRRAEVSDVVAALRDVWMPKHGVPATLLSDNGRQFVASVVREFCENVGIRKIYSTPYHPQGNSVVESYMRTLKKGLATLVAEDGHDWDLYLPAVALAHNSTPHLATGYSPYFLTHGREAILPVQRHLDEPRLDHTSRQWLYRLWRARANVYEAHMRLEKLRRKATENSSTLVPVGALVMLKLTQLDKADYPGKFCPRYMGPWVVVERFTNDITYRVRDLASAEQRQVTRDQMKVIDLPAPQGDEEGGSVPPLPRLATQGKSAEAATNAASDAIEVADEDTEPQALSEPHEPDPVAMAPLDSDEPTPLPEGRYGLRPVAVRRARAAAERVAPVGCVVCRDGTRLTRGG